MDLAGLISVISACSLLQLNRWEYRKHDVSALENHDDVIVLKEVLDLYIGPKAQETADIIVPAPSSLDPPSPKFMWCIIRRAASLPLFFFHALLSCHSFLFGPSQLSYEPSQQLLMAADYLNNTGNFPIHGFPPLGQTTGTNFSRSTGWFPILTSPGADCPKNRV